MEEEVLQIKFENQVNPNSFFEIVRIEELLQRSLNHDVCKHHIVNFYVILFIVEGQGYHTVDFTDYKYDRGTVLLIRKDQLHKFFKSTNAKGYLLVFTEEFIFSHLNDRESSKSLQLFNEVLHNPKIDLPQESNDVNYFEELIVQLQSQYGSKDAYSTSIARSILHIFMCELFRRKKTIEPLGIHKKYLSEFLLFQKLVEDHCFEDRKVNSYASRLNLTAKTLNNIVQSVMRKSAKRVIDDITIMQIKRLLIGTETPIKEIAYIVGFDDPSNFFKYFKKSVGSSPESFRNAHH